MTRILLSALPSAITSMGFMLGILGVALGSFWGVTFLWMSLVMDVLDGRAARALRVECAEGAILDWQVDVCLSYAIAWRFLGTRAALIATLGCFTLQLLTKLSAAKGHETRASGRMVTTLLATTEVLFA